MGGLTEDGQRWTVGLPYLTSCVRGSFHPRGERCSSSASSFTLNSSKATSVSKCPPSLSPVLFAALTSPTPPSKVASVFHTFTLLPSLPSSVPVPPFLCATPFPSCFPHSVHVSLPCGWMSSLASAVCVCLCARWRRRLCAAGPDWASSFRCSCHGAAHFPSSPGKQTLLFFLHLLL